MDHLHELWATGCIHAVAQGVLGAEFIWGEDLNKIPGLTDKLTADITLIRDKGMRGAVETIMKQ